ncbi:MAG: hypothetical protein KA713_00205 [Chryseotalea sp. WA131a]|nr:MAG: hypothetical protein KA713_00205 [Chryseotalea sp. WA131a]
MIIVSGYKFSAPLLWNGTCSVTTYTVYDRAYSIAAIATSISATSNSPEAHFEP